MSTVKKKRSVEITVPDIQEYDEVWDETDIYLTIGFLTANTVILGRSYVFKTLNTYEIRNIEFIKPPKKSDAASRAIFRSTFIAHSIFMVDGQNMLFERPRHIRRLVSAISKLPVQLQDKIIENLGALNSRANKIFPLTEVFVHENRSRFRWLQMGDTPIHSPLMTGISGTDELGMSGSQQMWTALNRLMDRREIMDREWQNAKFIGSCFAGKGVRSIDERDRGRAEKEKSDRDDLKMKLLYRYLNRLGPEAEPPRQVKMPDGRMVTVSKNYRADSAEELAEQLSAALSGEKDTHDLIVEAHEKKLMARARMMEVEQTSMFQSATPTTELNLQNSIGGSSRLVGGRAEADAYIRRLQELQGIQLKKAYREMGKQERIEAQNSDEPEELNESNE